MRGRDARACDRRVAAAPDEPGEWIYFADGKLDRSIFLIHHEDDDLMDQYWPMQQNMTVFGFGRVRSPLQMLMKDVPAHFTIGLCDARDYHTVKKIINSAYRDLSIKIGKPEKSGGR